MTRGIKTALAFLAMMAGVLALSGPAQAQDAVKIGVALSQTGNLADSAAPYFKGLDLWRQQANARGGLAGKPIEFVISRTLNSRPSRRHASLSTTPVVSSTTTS